MRNGETNIRNAVLAYLAGMKNAILGLLVLFLTTAAAHAQISVGMGGYLQNIGLSGDVPEDNAITSTMGFGIGLSLGWGVASDVDITLSPAFDVRNQDVSNVMPRTDSLKKVGSASLSSISIPLGVRIYGGNRSWFFTSGLAARLIQKTEVTSESDGTPVNIDDSIESFEVGVFLGVGYSIRFGSVSVLPELRYEQGLTNLLTGVNTGSLPPAPIMRSSGLSLRVAAEISLGGGQ